MSNLIRHLTSIPTMIVLAIIANVAAIDVYIPNMPCMVDWFNCSQETIQISTGISIIGGSILTPFIGPLSDAIGRRKLLVYSQLIYAVSCLAAAFAPNIEMFLLSRFVQGTGSAGIFVVGFAVIADLYKGPKAVLCYAYITTAITTTLVFAPLVGGVFASQLNWQSCFLFLSLLASIVTALMYRYLPETLAAKTKFSLKNTMKTYRDILANPSFVGRAVAAPLMIGGILVIITNSVFYYVNTLGTTPGEYSLYQAAIMVFNTICSYVAGQKAKTLGVSTITKIGVSLLALGGTSFFVVAITQPEHMMLLTAAAALYAGGVGFAFSAMTSEAMHMYPETAGTTSAVLSLIRGVLISTCISVSAYVYDGTIISVASSVLVILFLCLMIYSSLGYLERKLEY